MLRFAAQWLLPAVFLLCLIPVMGIYTWYTQTAQNSGLRLWDLLDGRCSLPCWYNITPGEYLNARAVETRVLAIPHLWGSAWSSIPDNISSSAARGHLNSTYTVSFRPGTSLNHIRTDIWVVNRAVSRIQLSDLSLSPTPITPQEVIAELGPPDGVFPVRRIDSWAIFDFWYHEGRTHFEIWQLNEDWEQAYAGLVTLYNYPQIKSCPRRWDGFYGFRHYETASCAA